MSKSRISGLKHLGIYGVVMALGVMGVWLGVSWYQQRGPSQSHTIVGQVISAKDGTIQVVGVHVDDKNPGAPDMTHATSITVKTDYGTGYFNTVWPIISKDMVAKRSSSNFQSFQPKTTQGSFADMQIRNLYITVVTREESFDLDSVTANMIKYNTHTP